MSKLICASTLLIVSFAGCGGQGATSAPPEEPSSVEMESTAPEQTESEATESESAEPEAAESESAEPEAAESETSSEANPAPEKEPPRKSCDGLPQRTCQVTVGCAWHTDKKCVEQ
ncbi:MAG: hypothetical protein JW940_09480 [Polyangiaceae bacterium]|nr:hypothetical protein [Polyangiaceae bacterium]